MVAADAFIWSQTLRQYGRDILVRMADRESRRSWTKRSTKCADDGRRARGGRRDQSEGAEQEWGRAQDVAGASESPKALQYVDDRARLLVEGVYRGAPVEFPFVP